MEEVVAKRSYLGWSLAKLPLVMLTKSDLALQGP